MERMFMRNITLKLSVARLEVVSNGTIYRITKAQRFISRLFQSTKRITDLAPGTKNLEILHSFFSKVSLPRASLPL